MRRLEEKVVKRLFTCMSLNMIFAAAFAQEQMLPAWTNNNFVTSESCADINYGDAQNFIDEHYLPAIGSLSSAANVELQFYEAYSISSAIMLRSQLCLAESLKLQDLTNELRQEQLLIQSGTSFGKNEMEKRRTLTSSADQRIREASEQVEMLEPEQKETYAMGVATYLAGVYSTSEMIKTVDDVGMKVAQDTKNLTQNVVEIAEDPTKLIGKFFGRKENKNASIADAPKAITFFTDVVPGIKNHLQDVYNTGVYLTQFSKEHDVELPADATSKLDGVLSWGTQ